MTTPHPIPAHPRFPQAANSLWRSVVRLLFFEQFFQSVAWDMEYPSNSTHTGALMVGRQNLILFSLAPLILWIHDCWLTTIFAQKLLTTCTIFAILDDIRAVALWTVKYDYFANHLAFILSFIKVHYQQKRPPPRKAMVLHFLSDSREISFRLDDCPPEKVGRYSPSE
jgi:hypothetical protein